MVTLETGKKLGMLGLPPVIQDFIVKSAIVLPAKSAAQPSSSPDFSKGKIDLEKILAEIEKSYLLGALEHTKGVRKKAASLLGLTFRSFRYRMEKLGLDSGEE